MGPASQLFVKSLLGAILLFCGFRLAWVGVGSESNLVGVLKHVVLVFVALAVGKFSGRLLHLQKGSNRLGQYARDKMQKAASPNRDRFSDGFFVCTLLYCAAPLAMIGPVVDGLNGFWVPLAVKAVMDGLGAVAFVVMFGAGVALSAVPVLVFQGTLAVAAARVLLPWLEKQDALGPFNTTAGFLMLCVAILVFDLKKIHVADYLPSLIFAPVFAVLLR